MAASKRRVLVTGAATAALLLGVAGYNWAQNQLEMSFHAFQDTRGVTVLSPDANFSKDFSDRTNLKVKFGVDEISAASDSCARCHPSGTNNGRFVTSANLTRKYGDSKVTVGGEFSRELSDALRNLVMEIESVAAENGGQAKGELSIKLGFKLKNGIYELSGDFKVKTPEARRAITHAWATPDNYLTPQNPNQIEMFNKSGVRLVPGADAEPRHA